MLGSSWAAAQVAASQEVLSAMSEWNFIHMWKLTSNCRVTYLGYGILARTAEICGVEKIINLLTTSCRQCASWQKEHTISQIKLSRLNVGRIMEELSNNIDESLQMEADNLQWLLWQRPWARNLLFPSGELSETPEVARFAPQQGTTLQRRQLAGPVTDEAQSMAR
jgi:hypothetical protein